MEELLKVAFEAGFEDGLKLRKQASEMVVSPPGETFARGAKGGAMIGGATGAAIGGLMGLGYGSGAGRLLTGLAGAGVGALTGVPIGALSGGLLTTQGLGFRKLYARLTQKKIVEKPGHGDAWTNAGIGALVGSFVPGIIGLGGAVLVEPDKRKNRK